MTFKDIVIHGHRESKDLEFFFTIKVKEEDITLEEKQFIRATCKEGIPFDLDLNPAQSSNPPVDPSTGEIMEGGLNG